MKGKETTSYAGAYKKKQPTFHHVNGIKHFKDKSRNLIHCDRLPQTLCKNCRGLHWWWQGAEHSCPASK